MVNGLFPTIKSIFNKHANLIFGAIGVVGVVGTAITSSIATKNAIDILREHENEDLTTKEKAKLIWPEYIWAGIVGVGTCGSIILSNVVSAKKAAALTAALLISKEQLDTTRAVFDDYRQETLKYLPQDPEEQKKLQKIIEKRPKLEEGEKPKYIRDHLGDILHFKEVDTGIEYDCRLIDFEKGLLEANSLMLDQDYCSMNIFHELIPNVDIPIAEIGWDIGWQYYYDGKITYTTEEHLERGPNDEGIIMVYVSFSKSPHPKKD